MKLIPSMLIGAIIVGLAYAVCVCNEDGRLLASIAMLCVLIPTHLFAIYKVRKGELTVYRNWIDLGCSLAWTVLMIVMIALVFMAAMMDAQGARFCCYLLALMCGLSGIASFVWMFVGAFLNNLGRVDGVVIALIARIFGAIFVVTYVSKVLDSFNKKDEMSVQNYAVSIVNLMIFGWIFKSFLMPLIADNRIEIKNQ